MLQCFAKRWEGTMMVFLPSDIAHFGDEASCEGRAYLAAVDPSWMTMASLWTLRCNKGTLQWRHDERDGVSSYRRLDCLLNHLFRRRSNKTSKLRVTGLCEGNPPVTGGFPSQRPVTRKIVPFGDVDMRRHEQPWCWWRHPGIFRQWYQKGVWYISLQD